MLFSLQVNHHEIIVAKISRTLEMKNSLCYTYAIAPLEQLFYKLTTSYIKGGANMTSLESFIRFVESLTTEQADFICEHLPLLHPSSGSEVLPDEEAVQLPLLEGV